MTDTETFTYNPVDGTDTCKVSFNFELKKEEGKIIIKHLTVDGEKGCIGHNKTIELLVMGRTIQDLPIEELKDAGCKRASSCSQELAKALELLLKSSNK